HYDDKYSDFNATTEFVRRLLGEVLLGAGRTAEGTRAIETVRDHWKGVAGFESQRDWPSVLDSLSAARRIAGDWSQAQVLLDESCSRFRKTQGPASPQFHRCEAQRTWAR